jgi:hypothetical protein
VEQIFTENEHIENSMEGDKKHPITSGPHGREDEKSMGAGVWGRKKRKFRKL